MPARYPGPRGSLPADQKANRVRRGQTCGRPPAFDRELYQARYVVERCLGRLKQFRAIAPHYDCEDGSAVLVVV